MQPHDTSKLIDIFLIPGEPTVPELSYFSNASSKVLLTASKLIVIRETSFSVHCSGSTSIPGPRSYEWAGLNTSTLSFTDIGVQDAGIYTCNVTNIMVRTVGATKTGRSSKHLIVEVQCKLQFELNDRYKLNISYLNG